MFYRKELLAYCIILSITILSSLTLTTITSNKSNDLLDGKLNRQKINGETGIQVNGLEITTVFPDRLYTERSYDIEWTYEEILSEELVTIFLLNDDDINLDMILASSISNDGQFEWEVPWSIDLADNYYFYIYCIDDFSIYDTSNTFSIEDFPYPSGSYIQLGDLIIPYDLLIILGVLGLLGGGAIIGTVFIIKTRQRVPKTPTVITGTPIVVAESSLNRPFSQPSSPEKTIEKDPYMLSDKEIDSIVQSAKSKTKKSHLRQGSFALILGGILLIGGIFSLDMGIGIYLLLSGLMVMALAVFLFLLYFIT